MPCVITDGRFDDEDLYAHLAEPNYELRGRGPGRDLIPSSGDEFDDDEFDDEEEEDDEEEDSEEDEEDEEDDDE